MSNIKTLQSAKKSIITPKLPLAHANAGLGGVLKSTPEAFRVWELRPEPLSGSGDHLILTLEKIGLNTNQLADQLARLFGVHPREVGYAGKKDRHAVTIQDFSVLCPNEEPEGWRDTLPEGVRLLTVGRDRRKIKVGHLSGNRFEILLKREPDPLAEHESKAAMTDKIEHTVKLITQHGVANYFGAQRFGNQGDNAQRGFAMLKQGYKKARRMNRNRRGMMISAVRSELFNQILAKRIKAGYFNTLLDGDIAQKDGRSGAFLVEDAEVEKARFQSHEIHPSGPLYGTSLLMANQWPGEQEKSLAEENAEAINGLAAFRVKGGRRALRVFPEDFSWAWQEDDLLFSFTLPRGSYATVVLEQFIG
ncbi:MAG: tRNA pseudouridine(13) synthase TruD [Magnetococcales bacterium]|nr:tRNA pseudouridine(13) synthase TruD [Magnetococcales bacterium]